LFWRYLPSTIDFRISIEETKGLDVKIEKLKIEIIGDMEKGKIPKYKLDALLKPQIHLKKKSATAFTWKATPKLLQIIRHLYSNHFINMIIYFKVIGTDSNGNRIESNTTSVILNKQTFKPSTRWW